MSERESYQRKYYRTRTLAKLRNRVKRLEFKLQDFMKSPEGQKYYKRKASEYGKQGREENKYL